MLAIVLTLAMLSAGCLGGYSPPWEQKKKELDVYALGGTTKTVQRGDNVTFFVVAKNKAAGNDSVTLAVGKTSAGLDASLGNVTFPLEGTKIKLPQGKTIRKTGHGTFLTVRVDDAATLGKFSITVSGHASRSGASDSVKLKVTVVDELTSPTLHPGQTVEIHYTGYLANGDVFETTKDDIAADQAVPKSTNPPFIRSGLGAAQALEYIVGQASVRKGIDLAVRQLDVGQSQSVLVPPELGYAEFVAVTVPYLDSVPQTVVMSWNNFTIDYNENPAISKVVQDVRWGWSLRVVAVDGINVTLLRTPVVGEQIQPYGWPATVVSVDSGANGGIGVITVRHAPPDPVTVFVDGKYKGSVVSRTDSTIVIRYNKVNTPLAERDLYYEIEVLRIVKK